MDVYEIVTSRILESLDKGVAPWRCPWKRGKMGIPQNVISKKPYSGINVFMLTVEGICKGYSSPYWLTYKQAQDLGGNVKKGEKSSIVTFWKTYEGDEIDERTGKVKLRWVLRYYNVFNSEQCENLGDRVPALEPLSVYSHNPIEAAEAIAAGMPRRPAVKVVTGNRAFYRPDADFVQVPAMGQFENPAEYYSVLFHELGHSTGHESRLNRDGITKLDYFGSHEYSKEELVAEFTASYLCGVAGIERHTLDNSAAYIRGWSEKLKDQNCKKWVVWAAAQAQKAADFIQGKQAAGAVESEPVAELAA